MPERISLFKKNLELSGLDSSPFVVCCCCLCAGLRVSFVAVAVVVAILMPAALIGVHSFLVVGAGALACCGYFAYFLFVLLFSFVLWCTCLCGRVDSARLKLSSSSSSSCSSVCLFVCFFCGFGSSSFHRF